MGAADEEVVVVAVAVVAAEDVETLVAADDAADDVADDFADDVLDELVAAAPSARVWLKAYMVRRLPAPQAWLEFPAHGMLQSVWAMPVMELPSLRLLPQ